jgi:tRNA (pseudouridine54-N1)-methyltransferase
VRRFAIVGSTATASDDFSLDDLPGTSGRLDVLVRCIRAALLHSHGVRRDAIVYLVLLGGPRAPRTLRFDGANAKFVRPDERALATLVKKSLAPRADAGAAGAAESAAHGFLEIRPGIAVARGGIDAILADAPTAEKYLLDENGADIRAETIADDAIFFLGDHLGLDAAARAAIGAAHAISVGPTSLHSDDVVAITSNEIDRATTRRQT